MRDGELPRLEGFSRAFLPHTSLHLKQPGGVVGVRARTLDGTYGGERGGHVSPHSVLSLLDWEL